jgi:enterochelin esterase family protein
LLIRVFIVGFVILVQGSGQDLESPRLQALRSALAQDSGRALDSFWNEVKTKAPLVERLDEHQGYALVTFLWRGEPRTQHVFVDGQLGQLTGTRPADNAMTQLAGTNLWYRSYWLRSDVRTIYRFSVKLEEPRAKPQPWITPRPNVAVGQTDQKTWQSALLNNEREIWVYTPANYADKRERTLADFD